MVGEANSQFDKNEVLAWGNNKSINFYEFPKWDILPHERDNPMIESDIRSCERDIHALESDIYLVEHDKPWDNCY